MVFALREAPKISELCFFNTLIYSLLVLNTSSSSPKKAHKQKEMGPQNWTLDPTPKTPLDPPPLEILYALYSAGKTNTYIKNLGA